MGVGASALEVEIAQRWTEMGIRVLQGYGQTEMGPVVSFTRPERNVIGTVGEPIPGVEVGSPPTARSSRAVRASSPGYWQNPAATAAAIDDDGWYHTGDLGTLRPDGLLMFRGRKKDMIALPDGQKVYPEDVETALRLDERIRDATVVAWPPGPNLRVHAVLLMDDPDAAVAWCGPPMTGWRHTSTSAGPPSGRIPTCHGPTRSRSASPRCSPASRPCAPARRAAVAAGPAAAGADVQADPVTTIVAASSALAGRSPPAIASRRTSTSTPSGEWSCWA